MEKPNLLWEIIRYSPQILFIIETTKNLLRKHLSRDISRIHYFLESEFGYSNIRFTDYAYCKNLLQSELFDPGLLFFSTNRVWHQLKSFRCKTQQVQVYIVPEMFQLYGNSMVAPQFWTFNINSVFMSGGYDSRQKTMKDCYTYNISTKKFERKENMNHSRQEHGLQQIAQKIYAFGGADGWSLKKSAEVYDDLKNSWKELPNMPKVGKSITCVRVQNQILMSSSTFRLMSYDIDNEAYSYVGPQQNIRATRIIVSSKEKLYLFEGESIFEMTAQCEVLNTITTHTNILECNQWNTNTEGKIFGLNNMGIVYCYDPFGARQLTEIQNLGRD